MALEDIALEGALDIALDDMALDDMALDGALDALLAALEEELDDELLDELLLDPDPLLEPHAETIRATAAMPASAPLRRRAVRE